MYGNGSVSNSYKEALAWCRKSADQEDANAQLNLGYMYEKGKACPKTIMKPWCGIASQPTKDMPARSSMWVSFMRKAKACHKATRELWCGFERQPTEDLPRRRSTRAACTRKAKAYQGTQRKIYRGFKRRQPKGILWLGNVWPSSKLCYHLRAWPRYYAQIAGPLRLLWSCPRAVCKAQSCGLLRTEVPMRALEGAGWWPQEQLLYLFRLMRPNTKLTSRLRPDPRSAD